MRILRFRPRILIFTRLVTLPPQRAYTVGLSYTCVLHIILVVGPVVRVLRLLLSATTPVTGCSVSRPVSSLEADPIEPVLVDDVPLILSKLFVLSTCVCKSSAYCSMCRSSRLNVLGQNCVASGV